MHWIIIFRFIPRKILFFKRVQSAHQMPDGNFRWRVEIQKISRIFAPKKDMLKSLELNPNELGDRKFFFGGGCEDCNQSGYRGRTGLFEMIKVSDSFREMINSGAATLVLRQSAIEQGMRTLREDGIRSIFDGESTVEEVLKYT